MGGSEPGADIFGKICGELEDGRAETAMIRRRQVLYVGGYDPQGADYYHGLFASSGRRFRTVWPLKLELGALRFVSDDFARWSVAAEGPNWAVATQYDFCRQDRFVRADLAEPIWRHFVRALRWFADDLVSGTTLRIFRAAWRPSLMLVCFQLLTLIWIAVSIAAAVAVMHALESVYPLPELLELLVGAALALAAFCLLRPLADRIGVVHMSNIWPRLGQFARGEATWFDLTIESGAQRLLAVARADPPDELVVIGHSSGGVVASAIVARALELDPDLGRRGPRLVLLTLGSVMPAIALHPASTKLRDLVAKIATEPSLTWIDCQARKDIFNFWGFDPVEGLGLKLGAQRCNPLVWTVPFKQMVTPEYYSRLRLRFLRLHYQFIIEGDRRAAYDYLMLIVGPVPVAGWAKSPDQALAAFSPDGAFTGYLGLRAEP